MKVCFFQKLLYLSFLWKQESTRYKDIKIVNKEQLNIQNSTSNIRYAGFWVRFIATWIDTAVVILPFAFIVYIISGGEWLDFSEFS